MTLKIAAVLALALGLTAFVGFLKVLGEGPFDAPEARHLRAMKVRRSAPEHPAGISFGAIDSLPSHAPLAAYAPIEGRGVVLDGYVQYMLRSTDGDTHLELTEHAPPPGSTSNLYVTAEITPEWYAGARAWRYEHLLSTFRPESGGNLTGWGHDPRRVRVTGWLLYDFQYDPVGPAGSRPPGSLRISGWEVHPVTKIEAWDEARAAFAEVPR